MKRKLPDIIDLTSDDEEDAIKASRPSGCISHPSQPSSKPISEQNKYDHVYARVTTIFPGISFEYVRQLHKRHAEANPDIDAEEALVNQIMDSGPYPQEEELVKVEKPPQKPLQPASSKTVWSRDDGVVRSDSYYRDAQYLLQLDFPKIPPEYIRSVLQSRKSLFAAYVSLDQAESTYDTTNPPLYKRLRSRISNTREIPPNVPMNSDRLRELQDAREERQKREESRRREKELAKLEAQNEATCIAQGNVMECQCCYADIPINRMIPCTGESIHFFCKECVKSTAKTQIGVLKYEVKCMDMSGCSASFDKQILAKVLGESLMGKLEQLQQRDEIAKAELEGLHDCPFCDFKAICPPVEVDREFRCQYPGCRKVSCRLCGLESHIPKTCEQANDKKTPARQKIEEAMSEALIRTCPNPKCKVKIVKEDGCNKMMCVKCRSVMCYVCKKDITAEGYKHFGKPPKRCPVHDPKSNARHFEEVSSAHKKAIEEVMKVNPQLNLEELAVEAPKKEHHTPSTLADHHMYLQHLQNQQQHYNALLRRGRIPGAPLYPVQPGAGDPGDGAQVPIHAPVDRNHPQPVAYPQPFPIRNGANQPDPFGRVLEWMNVVEQPPRQPIVQYGFQQAGLRNQGADFQIIPPPVMQPVPYYQPFQHEPNVQALHHNNHHHHHHDGHLPQGGHVEQAAPIPRHQPLEALNQNLNQHLNQGQRTHQVPQHLQAQHLPQKPERRPQFQTHQHTRHPQQAPLAPIYPTIQIGPNLVPTPPQRWDQWPNEPLVMGGAPERNHTYKQTEFMRPSPQPTQPAHMHARPAISGRHVVSNHNNTHNNNRPTFRYPIDIPDIVPQQFPRN
ncbi:hypothetical protein EMCG_00761 [[Emmonsia] crescens]|uniref:RING-type domain-containing protein n=1 Tax=[Emmonsia] crescens TaxID=73230 RepID=A0A0G2IYD1_9EURO|nr:hypothetical protein EMCG_00761 [Emmonsia crescens UAMH 3008]